ncbi:MAG: FAD-dependent oxidoreductase [Clostridium sp.]
METIWSMKSLENSVWENNSDVDGNRKVAGRHLIMSYTYEESYDVAVVGAGHAGCEAALGLRETWVWRLLYLL